MARTLHEMAVRLQEYIVDQLNNSFGATRTNIQRYNNLKLKMEVRDYPHIIITIGISKVTYNLDNGNRVEGGLGIDEKYVKRWMSSNTVMTELKAIYASFEEKFKEARAVLGKKLTEQEKEQEGVAHEINFKKLEAQNKQKKERAFFTNKKNETPTQNETSDNKNNENKQ